LSRAKSQQSIYKVSSKVINSIQYLNEDNINIHININCLFVQQKMIIPIQREESALSTMKSCLKSSKQSHTTPIPVSVNSNSSSPVPPLSNSSLIPTTFDRADDHWKDISALSIFEPRIKRWRRDDIEDFLLPSLGKRSLLKEKFSDLIQPFTTQPFPSFAPLLSMNEHPIKIETFNVESDKYVVSILKFS